MRIVCFLLLLLPLLSRPMSAQQIIVPDDYPTIQEAIDAASDRDTILVLPCTYTENIDFNGKSIVLASNFVYSGDENDIHNTIIDGSEPDSPQQASVVTFKTGEGSGAVLQGFTITGGAGNDWVDPQFPTYTWHSGGGIFIFRASPIIRDNIIIGNHCDDDTQVDGASGGGICMYDGNPLIVNNCIQYNTAKYGAGVVIDYSGCRFFNNMVSNNQGGQVYGGGGFWIIGNGDQPILIENNTIYNNEAVSPGIGGAMYIWSSQVILRNNIIWGNRPVTGGPIRLTNGGSATVTYSLVQGGYDGEGNIDEDPQFANPNLELADDSPCVDAGDPDEACYDTEDPDNPGRAWEPSKGTVRNDLGVFGGPMCLRRLDPGTGFETSRLNLDEINGRLSVYPNPVSDQAQIRFFCSHTGRVRIALYDPTGRCVEIVHQQVEMPGDHEISWTRQAHSGAPLPTGLYFCLMEYESRVTAISRIVLTK